MNIREVLTDIINTQGKLDIFPKTTVELNLDKIRQREGLPPIQKEDKTR